MKKKHDLRIYAYPILKKLIMKLKIAFIIIVAGVANVLASPTYSQAARVSLNFENKSLEQVMDDIERQSEFYFIFNQKQIDVNRTINIQIDKGLIIDILPKLFTGTNVNYAVINRQILLTTDPIEENLVAMMASGSTQQQQRITGKVTDATTGEPLAGVYVRIEGTNSGAVTDAEGNYSVEVPAEDAKLQFSFIGYNTETVPVAGRSQINIALAAEITRLDEIVVVGYGTQSKRTVTGSVQSVSADELSDMPTTSVAQKLQGKLSGVQINQTTGRPGEGMQIRIRGQASLTGTTGGNQPLYVVDGFPVIGDITSINPNEIESISILKDASSTALYGSRAANGVVMVTTKRAKTGKTAVNVNAYYGWQTVPQKGRPEMMNGTEFAQFKKESYEDLGRPVPAIFQDPSIYGAGYNIYDALLSTQPIQDYSISLSSSKDNFSTTGVVGFFSQDGVLLNSDYKRYSLRLNSDFKITERVKAGFNIAPTYTVSNSPNTDGIFWSSGLINNSLLSWPIFPYKNPDGSLPLMYFDPTVQTFPLPNYYRTAMEITNETKALRLLTNAFLQYEPIPGLVLKSAINFDFFDEKYNQVNPSTVSAGFATTLPTDASARFRTRRYNTWLNENTISYKKSIGDHSFDVIVGQSMQRYRQDRVQLSVTRIPDDRVPTVMSAQEIWRGGQAPNFNTFNEINEWSLMSYLGRLNYNYRNKYLLSAAIRADGSSRFGSDDRWGTFPSVSAGWIVSEESFMDGISAISLLKLRASYGIVGNNNIEEYNQYARVSSGSDYTAIFGTTVASGTGVSSIPNTFLTWEQTAEYDLGFDVGFFNNRINVGYDYYNRKTKSLLYRVAVSQESGFQNYWGNVGELQFWGHEIQLNTKNLVGDLKWSTDFNISFTDNKVNALTGVIDRVYGDWTITKVGDKVGLFYGLIWDGVYDNQEEFDNSPNNPQLSVGSIKYRDIGGAADGGPDGIITRESDNDDRTVIGDPTPKFIYGMTNNLSFKNFDLSIVVSGSYGNDILKRLEQGTTNLDGVFNVLKEVKDRWRSPENPGKGKYGRTTGGAAPERDWASSRFVAKASFLSIKNITLGYTIPMSKIKGINSLRVYASAQQVYTFTKYDGTNPEVSMTNMGGAASALNLGQDYGGYPIPRTISFGLNLGL